MPIPDLHYPQWTPPPASKPSAATPVVHPDAFGAPAFLRDWAAGQGLPWADYVLPEDLLLLPQDIWLPLYAPFQDNYEPWRRYGQHGYQMPPRNPFAF